MSRIPPQPSRRPNRPPTARPASPSRVAALALLTSLRQPKAPGFDVLLEEMRHSRRLSPQDAGLAREIAYGVCRHRRWLEQVLTRYLERSLPSKAFHVHEALLVGLYQTLYLDRIPAHTIVDETVRLVASFRTEATYRGLANAIMRRVVSEQREALLPTAEAEWPLREGIPDWLATEAGQVLPRAEIQAFFAACNVPAPLNFRRTLALGVPEKRELAERLRAEMIDQLMRLEEVTPAPYAPDCLLVEARGLYPESLPSFRRGHLTIEDEAAQIVCHLAGAEPGQQILDLCAAPGGKTAHLADLAERRPARLVACDVSPEKLDRLRNTLQRLGLNLLVETLLSEELIQRGEQEAFDLVLVDAPCSSLGTLRRHPEVRWRRQPKQLKDYAARQLDLMHLAKRLVRRGGRLVYSVCTFTAQETDGVVDSFLAAAKDFRPGTAPKELPFDATRFAAGDGRWRTFPHRDGCDGFFVAILEKARSG